VENYLVRLKSIPGFGKSTKVVDRKCIAFWQTPTGYSHVSGIPETWKAASAMKAPVLEGRID
jgi:hypothetical protein